jgi:uncharacterized membrane protein YeiH
MLDKLTFHNIIELLGVISFALSGAFSAMQKRLDVFGILVLTFVTAIGGGTVRDVLIGSMPVAWIQDLELIYAMFFAFFISIFFSKKLQKLEHTLFWLDTAGLAFFCIVAIEKGIQFHLHPIICIALGTITGSFGGIIRDVLLNEIPYVFRKDVYASACIAGGIIYFVLLPFISDANVIGIVAGAVIMLIRIGAKYFKWSMPDIYRYR